MPVPVRSGPSVEPGRSSTFPGGKGLTRRGLLSGAAVAGAAVMAPARSGSAQPPAGHVQAVVSAHELATNAGADLLAAGGTAADAMVGMAAVLSVVEPWFSNVLGGDSWGLYYDTASQEVTSLDGVGPVARSVDVAAYEARAGEPGMHQAIVPGAWDAWMLWLDRFGRLDLGEVLAPAIRVAREGFPASAVLISWLERLEDDVRANPGAARIYLIDDRLAEPDDTLYQNDLAATFERLAEAYATSTGATRSEAIQAARDFYYRGPLGEAVIDYSQANGGFLTLEDLQAFAAEIVEPISIQYTGEVTVYQCPPNSQGITMLLALNILKGIDFAGKNIEEPDVIHAQVEAIKLAFADRYAHVGDPTRVAIPIEELLSDAYAESQRARIDMSKAMAWPVESGIPPASLTNTSTLHVVDREGNVAGATTSIGAQFEVVGDTGIHMNARMAFLSLEPQNPNLMTPGYKVRHTSCPYMAFRNGRPYITGGNTGVDTQPQAQTQQFLNVVDFGLGAQRSIDRPRFVSTAFPATNFPWEAPNTLQLEAGFPDSLVKALEERGHRVVVGEGIVGAAALVILSEDGQEADAGSESRSDTASSIVRTPRS
jgi:gamma-glutamyltranspeptidase/glutathione hydrolase